MTVPACAANYFQCVYDRPWTLVNIRQIFTSALQVHWMDPQHHLSTIGTDDLSCLRYVEDEQGVRPSERLAVAPTHTLDEHRPVQGVYLGTPGGLQLKKLALDNYAGHNQDLSGTSFAHAAQASLQITHVHPSADMALLMATSTSVFLYALRQHLKDHPDFMGFEPQGQTDALLLEKEGTPYYKVDIGYQFMFNYRASVTLESHRLKTYGQLLNNIA